MPSRSGGSATACCGPACPARTPERAAAAERARGLLPPGRLADDVMADIDAEVERLAAAIASLGFEPGPADSLDIHLDLPEDRGLIGTVANRRGGIILVCTYSRLAPKHRLGAWVRFLGVSAARPEMDASVITVGRGQGHQPPQVSLLAPLAATSAERRQRALDELAVILDLYRRGLQSPLPMACATSAAWAGARHLGKDEDDAYRAAEDKWNDSVFPGEVSDPEHRYVWGAGYPLARLMDELPAEGEDGPGWPASERRRFARLAGRLWYPLLAHEKLGAVG